MNPFTPPPIMYNLYFNNLYEKQLSVNYNSIMSSCSVRCEVLPNIM